MTAPTSAWAAFLESRAALIDEMRADGMTPTQIARVLSMDAVQVTLILARPKP